MNLWCERGDSNPHGFTRQILSLVRLPIPPLSHYRNNSLLPLKAAGKTSRAKRPRLRGLVRQFSDLDVIGRQQFSGRVIEPGHRKLIVDFGLQ